MVEQWRSGDNKLAAGRLGELLVEVELVKRGFHVERLDGSSKAMNGDLIAVRRDTKAIIQVKTNTSQSNRGFFGYATKYLTHGEPFFNAKPGPIVADFLVIVTNVNAPIFHILGIEEAEDFARTQADRWFATPKRDGSARSASFPVSPVFSEISQFREKWEIIA